MIVQPTLVRVVRRMPLPAGITALLEVAAGDPHAIRAVTLVPRGPRRPLTDASGFFIEQAMLADGADSYRILGCSSDAPGRQLRRHMALLVRWLHPDRLVGAADDLRIDRTVFAHRVTQAWEDLKTRERRATYDRRSKYEPVKRRASRRRSKNSPAVSLRASFGSPSGRRRRICPPGAASDPANSPFTSLIDFWRNEA